MKTTGTSYAQTVTLEHRENLGQFFTPGVIADVMCEWALQSNPAALGDPAFGMGAFFDAAAGLGYSGQFIASEIDPTVVAFYQEAARGPANLSVHTEDYLQSWGKVFDAIVCNPPYTRFQGFLSRSAVRIAFQDRLGVRLSGYTNMASAFLLKSLSELKPGGRLAYIMPLEFLNTGYGTQVKEALLKRGRLKAIIRINGEESAFADVMTTVCVVLVADDGIEDSVVFATADTADDLTLDIVRSSPMRVPHHELGPEAKWSPHFELKSTPVFASDFVPLLTYGRFSRGIATGANEFFALTKDDIRTHGIETRFLSPCVTKSAQINGMIFDDRDLAALIDDGAPAYVLDVRGEPSSAVLKYIRSGEASGYHLRYLTRARSPWYKLERRDPFPILLNVFSRGGYKVIRNYSHALAFTCYHGFSPGLFGVRLLDHLFLFLHSEAGRAYVMRGSRRYGRGLDKFEPNDLNRLLVPGPDMFRQMADGTVAEAMAELGAAQQLPTEVENHFAMMLRA